MAYVKEDTDKVLWERESGGKLLRLTERTYKGHVLLDIRKWYYTADGWRPGSQGLAIPEAQIRELAGALAEYTLEGVEGGK